MCEISFSVWNLISANTINGTSARFMSLEIESSNFLCLISDVLMSCTKFNHCSYFCGQGNSLFII